MTSGRPKKTTGNVMMDELLKLTGKRKLKPTMPTSKSSHEADTVHPCPSCNGYGTYKDQEAEAIAICPQCNGTGQG